MNMTVDQMVDFLTDSFHDIDRETLFLILQSNNYHLENTLEMLFSMESDTRPQQSQAAPQPKHPSNHSHLSTSPTSSVAHRPSSASSPSKRRGAKVALPDDFLRVPGFSEKRQEYVETGSLVNLLADPLFLQELEREFGPNYQSVLREHLQAEALRNTADRAPYSDHPQHQAPPQQVIINAEPPRQFYVSSSSYRTPSASSTPAAVPYSREYYNQAPPPYPHANVSVGQQQPPVLSHQSTFQSPPPQQQPSSSNSWFTSPFSASQTTTNPPLPPTDQAREPMLGFGGGAPPPPRDEGPTISERFQNILKAFPSPFSDERQGDNESKRGLLSEEDEEGEEGDWEGGSGNGIQMESKKRSQANEDNNSADL